jgi:hypothetical protein
MSEHEPDVTPAGPEAESIARHSTNGSESGGVAVASNDQSSDGRDDGSTFLADLARAMQTTAAAEQARNAEATEHRREAHIAAIRARETLEAEDLRELAKEDVKGIDQWSDGEIRRIKLERERRIAARRDQLQVRLEEHRSVIGREVEAVESAIATYRTDIELYFRQLGSEIDPVAIARHAGNRPPFPVLEQIGADDAPPTSTYETIVADSPRASEAVSIDEGPAAAGDDVPPPARPLFAVMAADEESGPAETPAAAGQEAVAEPASAIAELTSASDETARVHEGSDVSDPSAESAEAVAAVAETRVIMPKITSAGSWLRWPNNSGDRSDSSR